MAAKKRDATETDVEEGAIRVSMATDPEEGVVIIRVGSVELRMPPDDAEAFSNDIMMRVYELRTGGRLG